VWMQALQGETRAMTHEQGRVRKEREGVMSQLREVYTYIYVYIYIYIYIHTISIYKYIPQLREVFLSFRHKSDGWQHKLQHTA